MPSGMLPIVDTPITRGMNTVDDPKRLGEGECVRLLNFYPGRPPRPREGCPGVYKSYIDFNDDFQPPIIAVKFPGDDNVYAVAWIYSLTENKYHLTRFIINGSDAITQLGYGEIDKPIFGMVPIHSGVYCLIDKSLTLWDGDTKALSHKVIESAAIVRDMCISEAAQIDSVTEASGGSLTSGKFVEYAFQYVRRTDSAAFTSGTTPTGMILPPGISGAPKRIDTHLPGSCIGIENSANRKVLEITVVNAKGVIDISSTAADAAHAIAIAQGATHLRVSRSSEQNSVELAQAATKFFLCDLPLGIGTTSFDDTTSDAALSGEINQLLTGYSVAPAGSFGKYHLGRFYIMSNSGKVYYSETVGGDGAYDIENSQVYPQAWCSLYKPTSYFIDCHSSDGVNAAGIESLENDLFFFKESKIFALFGGDPTAAAVSVVSDTIGCPLPHTIKKIDSQNGSSYIFFLSNQGPAILTSGGRIELFSDFKIKELWPHLDRTIVGQFEMFGYPIKRECTCIYYKNTIWIFFRNSFGYKRIFGFYFDPNNSEIRGPMEIELATGDIFGAIACIDNVNLKAYLFGKSTNYLVVTEFLRDYYYEDLVSEEVFLKTDLIADQNDFIADRSDNVLD